MPAGHTGTYKKIGSTWRELFMVWRKNAGVWEELVYPWRKVGGVWKICMDYNCVGSVTPAEYIWQYNETDIRTFVVNCNKAFWHFTSESSYSDFNVTVWDPTNTTQITNGIYTDGMVVRVSPKTTNSGGTNKYCHIYIASYDDLQMTDCTFTGIQYYAGESTPPIVNISCDDGTMTLASLDHVLNIGDTDLWIQFVPSAISPTPPQTIYVTVVKSGPIYVGSGTIPSCHNGVTYSKWITLNEAAVAGRNYYIYLSTNNS